MTNKRFAIIEATIERLFKEGRSFSTEDVARDVGCSQSLVFRYFRSKDNLISACFDEICHEIRMELDKVPFLDKVDPETIWDYMMDVWEAYFNYLSSKRSNARVYVGCVSLGYRYLAGYDSLEAVLKRILDRNYGKLVFKCPNAKLMAEYLIMVANAVAMALSTGWGKDVEDLNGFLKDVLMNGILSQCEGSADHKG